MMLSTITAVGHYTMHIGDRTPSGVSGGASATCTTLFIRIVDGWGHALFHLHNSSYIIHIEVYTTYDA